MSGVVVVIGYLLLLPSIFGMITSLVMLFAAGQAGSTTSVTADTARTAVVGGVAVFFLISSFVVGLLGWLLVMKKKVLQCSNCGAIVAAS